MARGSICRINRSLSYYSIDTQRVKFTVITGQTVLWERPEIEGQAETTGQVDFSIVAPTCAYLIVFPYNNYDYGIN